MGVPFVAIEYESHKTKGIIGSMMGCGEYVYDIKKLEYKSLLDKIMKVWSKKECIHQDLLAKAGPMKDRAFQNTKKVQEVLGADGQR